MRGEPRPLAWWPRLALRLTGAGLLIATAAIHLDLYLTGYRAIPTIGWLFLLQVIAAFGLGVLVLAVDSRLADAAGAGFALATLGGYLLSLWAGLFGFTEVRTTAGIVAGVIEVAAIAALGALAATPVPGRRSAPAGTDLTARAGTGAPGAGWMAGAVAVAALAALGASVAAAGGGGAPAAAASVRATTIHGVRVLVNANGFALYWFAPDTAGRSVCHGTCAAYWPPVKGPVAAGRGVPGKFGVITRSDGSKQATYNGRPLYTYIGDKAPGQANGDGLDLNGGLWHEVRVPG